MSNEKFTPGPWEADCRMGVFVVRKKGDKLQCLSEASDDSIVYQRGRGMKGSNYGYLTDEQEANAYLIAAAPEMYALLSKCSSCINYLLHGVVDDPVIGESENTMIEIKELLKKARGEE